MSQRQTGMLPLLTVALSVLLGMIALPDALALWRPYWLALVMIYWLLETPDQVGLGLAFVIGLTADLAFGTLFGEQALRLCILVFLIQRFRTRLRFFPIWQQALAVLVFLLNDRLLAATVRLFSGEGVPPVSFWYAPLAGAALWPWLYLLLDYLRLLWRRRQP